MADSKKFVETVLLPLQLILGIWQTMKTTTVWVVIHCTIKYLLDCCRFPFTDYKHLRGFQGRVFKKAIIHATAEEDLPMKMKMKKQKDPTNLREMNAESVSVKYLGQEFELKRKGDKMQVRTPLNQKFGEKGRVPSELKDGQKDCGPVYYITDKMWETIKCIGKIADEDSVNFADKGSVLFVKNHKELRGKVVTGDIMEFEEVLDSVILDNRAVVRLDQDYFLPVNLVMPEDKVLTTLNLVSLFVQAFKNIHWLIPALVTFASALLVSSEYLRKAVYFFFYFINIILFRGLEFLCDLLPYKARRSVYSWCSWIEERFKPTNEFHAKIVIGSLWVLVAGGTKFDSQSEMQGTINCNLVDNVCCTGGPFLFRCDPNCDLVYIEWTFDNSKCSLKSGHLTGSRPSLKECKTYILCGDGNEIKNEEITFYACNDTHSVGHLASKGSRPSLKECKTENKEITFYACNDTHSAISGDMETGKKSALTIHSALVDIDCSAEEAQKLFIFAHYMAH